MNDSQRFELISELADKWLEMGLVSDDKMSVFMDLDYLSSYQARSVLNLIALRDARPQDFAHDMAGIYRHFNRQTKQLEGGFMPRCNHLPSRTYQVHAAD